MKTTANADIECSQLFFQAIPARLEAEWGWFTVTVGFATLPQWSKQSKQAYSGFWYIFGGPMSNLAQNRRDAPLNYLHDTSL